MKRCFRQLAQVSGGAFAHFDARSAGTLAELLGAVARFATGGQKALADSHSESAKLLLQQLKS